jgi:hypothetical protein
LEERNMLCLSFIASFFFAVHCQLTTSNCQLTSPLSCRWRSDWLPCHPSQSIGGIHDRRFHFFTFATDPRPSVRLAAGNFRNCALRCGGDRRCPFVGCITVAACLAR